MVTCLATVNIRLVLFTSGKMWVNVVDSKTPPPKHNSMEMIRFLCFRVAGSAFVLIQYLPMAKGSKPELPG